MPIPIGPIIRAGRVAYDAYAIPKRIETFESELRKPLTSYFQGIDLCYARIDLEKVKLYRELAEADNASKLELIKKHYDIIKEIIMDNKDDLKAIPATRFDIEGVILT